jgi:hypothetical protein
MKESFPAAAAITTHGERKLGSLALRCAVSASSRAAASAADVSQAEPFKNSQRVLGHDIV